MELTAEVCRKARLSRDPRFDGQFFTGVKTTGIFCRPICPVVPPKEENVDYYPSAAAALEAGFRPCLRCRPETAPQSAAWKGIASVAARILRKINEGFLADHSVPELADVSGISERYLRKLCVRYAGAGPAQLELARKSLLAKQLLFDSSLSIADIAYTAGYNSVRRFNEHWKSQFAKTPSAMRRRPLSAEQGWIRVQIPVAPDFDYAAICGFLASRCIDGVEVVEATGAATSIRPYIYRRVMTLDGQPLLVELDYEPARRCLLLSCEQSSVHCLPRLIATVKRVFDVEAPAGMIMNHLAESEEFKTQLQGRKDIRLPGAFDPFEAAVRAIVGQQVSVKAACTLLSRLTERCGEKVPANRFCLERAFPTAIAIVQADLNGLGITGARIRCLKDLAQLKLDCPDVFSEAADPQWRRDRMQAIKGIGPWTLSYLEMRAFSLPDAFPAGDLGVRAALEKNGLRPSETETQRLSVGWQPWRAYATLLLWQRLV